MTRQDKDSTDGARSARTVGDVQRVLTRVGPELPLSERVILSVSTLFETERPNQSAFQTASHAQTHAPGSSVRPRNLLEDLLLPDPAFDESDGDVG
ncbi:MAG: hypothetical protein H6729_06875 [Deltaproteobacteria bacterium]|nr:hypothetical protein [Deltaproteobacteria bacterium]